MSNELARRAVACKHWRWLPGMRERATGWRWSGTAYISQERYPESGNCIAGVPEPLPDLSDPCSLGGLLALVREAWGCDGLTCQPLLTEGGVHGWLVYMDANRRTREIAATEAEALVAALEAAP